MVIPGGKEAYEEGGEGSSISVRVLRLRYAMSRTDEGHAVTRRREIRSATAVGDDLLPTTYLKALRVVPTMCLRRLGTQVSRGRGT